MQKHSIKAYVSQYFYKIIAWESKVNFESKQHTRVQKVLVAPPTLAYLISIPNVRQHAKVKVIIIKLWRRINK
jgi:hypothetical protein